MDVVALGSSVMDLLVNIDHQVRDNGLIETNNTSWQYGGKVSTGIIATKMLCPDADCAILGNSGGMYGRLIRQDFVRRGVDISYMNFYEDKESPFCVALSMLDTNVRNFYLKPPTYPAYSPEELDEELIKNCKYLYIEDSFATTQKAIEYAQAGGAEVVFDADSYWPEGMPETIAQVDYFIPSEDTYYHMFPKGGFEENLRTLQTQCKDGAVIIVTLGENGVVGIDENGAYFEQPGYHVDVVDTTGAGDVYHGAFIACLLRGMGVRDASQFAQAVSAIKCTRIGGRAAIPTYEVAKQFIDTGKIDYTEIDSQVEYYSNFPLLKE